MVWSEIDGFTGSPGCGFYVPTIFPQYYSLYFPSCFIFPHIYIYVYIDVYHWTISLFFHRCVVPFFSNFAFLAIYVFIIFPSIWFCAYNLHVFPHVPFTSKRCFPFQFPLLYIYFHGSLTFPYLFFCNFPYFWNIFFPCHFSEAGTTAQVPSVTASVVTLPEAFRPTAFRSALHGPDTWRCRLEVENPMGKPRSEAMIRTGKPRVNQPRCGKTHGFPWENGGCSKSMLVDRRVTRSWY